MCIYIYIYTYIDISTYTILIYTLSFISANRQCYHDHSGNLALNKPTYPDSTYLAVDGNDNPLSYIHTTTENPAAFIIDLLDVVTIHTVIISMGTHSGNVKTITEGCVKMRSLRKWEVMKMHYYYRKS